MIGSMTTDPEGLPMPHTAAVLYTGSDDNWLAQMLADAVLVPATDMATRPSKKIRARLVDLGFVTSHGMAKDEIQRKQIDAAGQAIELLHTGSLMIDDIQDQSLSRRGDQAAHEKFGTNAIITVGNWLYFWPLRLLEEQRLSPTIHDALRRHYLHALEKAHMGQALDLKIRMDEIHEERWEQIVETTLNLKTASITELAMAWGATLGEASTKTASEIGKLGFMFGVLLQKLDDLGNLFPAQNEDKLFEDVICRKPSWIWVLASRIGLAQELLSVARNVDALNHWQGRHEIRAEGLRCTENYWQAIIRQCETIEDRSGTLVGSLCQLKDNLYADYFSN